MIEAIRYRLGALVLRLTPLRVEITRLAEWLELEVLPLVDQFGASAAELTVGDNEITVRLLGRPEAIDPLPDCPALCRFLGAIGVDQIEAGPRLESNQISDILRALYIYQRRVAHRDGTHRRLVRQLLSLEGLHLACAETHLAGARLTIVYSYCTLRYSRLVAWFERRNRNVGDHRALFRAAPVLSLIPPVILVAAMLAAVSLKTWWPAAIIAAILLYALSYLFCMVIGSLEYDKEERAYQLRQAYGQLRRYTERVQKDLARARAVQQKLLPDLANMPLADRLTWAADFLPETDVGGDYFDAADCGNGMVAIVFADVSGHGMAAAFITAILKTAFQDWTRHRTPIEDFIREANRSLIDLTPDESFAALMAGVLDTKRGEFRYVNCGHAPAPVHIPADPNVPAQELTEGGMMILGISDALTFEPASAALRAGDRLLMATDGLIEAINTDDLMYGRARLADTIEAHRRQPLGQMVEALVGDVAAFAEGIPQTDDRTVLAFELRA